MLCFRQTFCVCKRKNTTLSYRMGQKLSTKLLFIYSPNNDGFYIFHISQGSVATQLRCDCMFGNHFITNFPQNAPVKIWRIGQYLTKIWTKLCFWATLYISVYISVVTAIDSAAVSVVGVKSVRAIIDRSNCVIDWWYWERAIVQQRSAIER